MNGRDRSMNVYIGSYSRDALFGDGSVMHGKGAGISRFLLNPDTGELTAEFALDTENPSYLTVNKEETMIYSVNELEEYDGVETGCVSSFRIMNEEEKPGQEEKAGKSRKLQFVNRKITRGLDPCHVALTPDEQYLCAANYTSGSFCVFRILPDGSIGEEVQFVQHEGRGKDDFRQEGPHCHSTVFSPDGRFAYVQNLGTDEIYCYRYQPDQEQPFAAVGTSNFRSDPGDGPRFLCFERNGMFAYAVNELSNSITVLRWNQEDGRLSLVQKVSSLEEEKRGMQNLFADVHLSADNHHLYASNRGDDSIMVFDVNQKTGELCNRRRASCEGKTPRNFAVDPTGAYLLCANQDSDNLVVFAIDPEDGTLRNVRAIRTGSPVCVQVRA